MAVEGFPEFYQMPWVQQDGELTDQAALYHDQLSQVVSLIIDELNSIIDVNSGGVIMPSNTAAEITGFGADANVPLGTVWFNTDTSKLQVKTAAGTIETITSS